MNQTKKDLFPYFFLFSALHCMLSSERVLGIVRVHIFVIRVLQFSVFQKQAVVRREYNTTFGPSIPIGIFKFVSNPHKFWFADKINLVGCASAILIVLVFWSRTYLYLISISFHLTMNQMKKDLFPYFFSALHCMLSSERVRGIVHVHIFVIRVLQFSVFQKQAVVVTPNRGLQVQRLNRRQRNIQARIPSVIILPGRKERDCCVAM